METVGWRAGGWVRGKWRSTQIVLAQSISYSLAKLSPTIEVKEALKEVHLFCLFIRMLPVCTQIYVPATSRLCSSYLNALQYFRH